MPKSINSRVLIVAGIALVAFLGGAGLVIDEAFRGTAMSWVQERLKGQVYMLLGLADFDNPSEGILPEALPDPALALPDSGHYAQIFDAEGGLVWRSRSMLGLTVHWPGQRQPGQFQLEKFVPATGEELFCLSYPIQWEGRGRTTPTLYTLQACEGQRVYFDQVHEFQRRLWVWFSGLAVFLLLIQMSVLRWGLRPLRQVANEVRAIEAGRQHALAGIYPRELQALTQNLNALISARDSHLTRYRNALGDLAHSLKTPLAVIRSTLESDPHARELARVLGDQVDQLDSTIKYQLQRAATVGRSAFGPPRPVAPVIERIAGSLRKVYHARHLAITAEAEPSAQFYGDQGDLMEIVGNAADNACKWARSKVTLEARQGPPVAGHTRRPLLLRIADDGPGMPPDQIQIALRRGGRLDESIEGHGIGLAVVRDIVEGAYGGLLDIVSGPEGTAVSITLYFD